VVIDTQMTFQAGDISTYFKGTKRAWTTYLGRPDFRIVSYQYVVWVFGVDRRSMRAPSHVDALMVILMHTL